MTIFKTILVCPLAGLGAGVGTGFAGMSAAAVIGPVLATFLGVPIYSAVGIGLASDVLASAVSAYTYKKNNNLDIKNSLPLLISVLVMTIVGSFVANLVPEHAMNGSMQIAMIIIGLRFIAFPVRKTRNQMASENHEKFLIKSIVGGIMVGFICGFIGAGGGMMLLFVLTSFLGYEMHMAVGTSVFIMTFTALTGSVSHFVIGGITDVIPLILCVVFTLIFARIASKIANRASAVTLNRVVGIVMILTSIAIITVNLINR